jgi:hypothetical protein
MTLSLAAVVALGLDGFFVCACLGPLRLGRARTCLLAAMCGVSDAVATAVGAAYGLQASWDDLIPGIVVAWLLVVLLSGKRARTLAFSMPVPLALDNLVAGASPSLTNIAVAGTVSALLAFAGLCLGAWLASAAAWARRLDRRLALSCQPESVELASVGPTGCVEWWDQ